MLRRPSENARAIFSPIEQKFVGARFALSVAAAILAVLLRQLLDPVIGHVSFYATVYMTVAFCAIVSGFFPAVLNALIGFFGVFYFFVDPRHSIIISTPEIQGVVAFFLVCSVLIALGVANRNKQLKLNATIDALTTEAAERKRAEEALHRAHDELEQRVKERTSELSEALARLKAEISVREGAEAQLRRLSVRLMTLQDEERRRIARDLHDTAGQTLSAMKLSIAALQQVGAGHADSARLLNDLNTLTDETLREVRTTSYLLHPPLLDEAGFASAARWFVDGFAKRSGIQVTCEIPQKLDRPPAECELVLFRVLQESLTNVHRHSGASVANIKLVHKVGQLTLEVGDNGAGIARERLLHLQTSDGSGVGIAGMRERVRELGGVFEIQSSDGGTTVAVTVPVPKALHSAHENLSFSAM